VPSGRDYQTCRLTGDGGSAVRAQVAGGFGWRAGESDRLWRESGDATGAVAVQRAPRQSPERCWRDRTCLEVHDLHDFLCRPHGR